MTAPPGREMWTPNDDGDLVPRRTDGSAADGYGPDDFALVCKHCGEDWSAEPDLPLGVIREHFLQHHPDVLGPEGRHIELELLWLGRGPAPMPGWSVWASQRTIRP